MRPTIEWQQDRVLMIDQRKLPNQELYVECRDTEQVAHAIETMVIRGAPAIGVAAAYGVALGALDFPDDPTAWGEDFKRVYRRLEQTRPTARNLFWALEQMQETFERHRGSDLKSLQKALLDRARAIDQEDVAMCRRIGAWGKGLIQSGQTILTHCNAGGLATAGYGTALGVVRAACDAYSDITVYADETRPLLQGARLTCWELEKDGIPVVLITDNMAGYLMQRREISLVVTGADRIAGNGDTANKIGTYGVAVLARENGIPFYVAAPLNTVDFSLDQGSQIPIEERHPDEVRRVGDCLIAPPEVRVRNPAFDVTPARYISAIITDLGIARPPFTESLAALRNAPDTEP
jgi:methylthioribose-1-phosphate isomerase